jgi:hypothetical protein
MVGTIWLRPSWDRPFAKPIELPKGKKVMTLHDAALYITKLLSSLRFARPLLRIVSIRTPKSGETTFVAVRIARRRFDRAHPFADTATIGSVIPWTSSRSHNPSESFANRSLSRMVWCAIASV